MPVHRVEYTRTGIRKLADSARNETKFTNGMGIAYVSFLSGTDWKRREIETDVGHRMVMIGTRTRALDGSSDVNGAATVTASRAHCPGAAAAAPVEADVTPVEVRRGGRRVPLTFRWAVYAALCTGLAATHV